MQNTPVLPAYLLNKYDYQVASYITYPTEQQFHRGFDGLHFERHSTLSNASLLPKDLSIYVHVPCCDSLGYIGESKTVITQTNTRTLNNYLERLLNEITMRGKLFSDGRLLTHIHFVGAAANILSSEQLVSILEQIALQFHLDLPSNLEVSIELDPSYSTALDVEALVECGINHFSIGVQSYSEKGSKASNHELDEERTLAIIEAAMRLAKSVNVDLITALPLQNNKNIKEILSRVIDTGVTRVAAYDLAYHPKRTRVPKMSDATTFKNADTRLALSSVMRSQLLQASYKYIGMDHYVLPSDKLSKARSRGTLRRNFQGYTAQRDTDQIGVGACAISKLDTAFSQNESSLSLYSELVDDRRLPIAKGFRLSSDDRIRADVIEQIICCGEVDLSTKLGQFSETSNPTPLFEYLKLELLALKSFEKDGLVQIYGQSFEITEIGRYFMRPIAAVFDRYLNPRVDTHILPFSRNL